MTDRVGFMYAHQIFILKLTCSRKLTPEHENANTKSYQLISLTYQYVFPLN